MRTAQREVRAGALLLLAGSLGALVPGCTFIIGSEPEKPRDSGSDHDAALDDANSAPDADDEGMADAAVLSDDAGNQVGDAGEPPDASGLDAPADAAADAALDASDAAARDAALDASNDGATAVEAGASDAGAADADAGPAPLDCDAGAVTWYPDGDLDGYGRTGESISACPKPAGDWSRKGGDCRDNDDRVHPQQLQYFGAGYALGNGKDSFDYDCSGQEEGDPGQATRAKGCGGLLGLNCAGAGYTERGDRSGAGLNAMCGSNMLVVCQQGVLSCETTTAPTPSRPYSCR